MKIIFLNTWHGKIKEPLEAFIKGQKEDTDIFCLQEVNGDAESICSEILTSFNSFRLDKYVAKKNEYSQAIYVNKNINVISNGSVLKDNAKCGLDQYIEFVVNGQSVWLSNIHGTPVPREKYDSLARIEQSKLLTDFFKDKDGIKILGGDFNLFPDSKSLKMFESSEYNNLIRNYKISTTRNHFAWGQWPTKYYFSDYVFTSRNVAVKGFKVLSDEVSDHLPMVLEL